MTASSFIIELGQLTGEGRFQQWESGGFYGGYTEKGPVIVATHEEAFRFPNKERAGYIPAADVRLKAHRIVTSELLPNV